MAAWLPPLAYALVCVVLFREFVFTGAPLLGTDTTALSYFARDFYAQFVRDTGAFPLWDPLLFGGLPFVDGMHGDIFYPPSLALFGLDTRTMWGVKMVLHVWLAGVFMFLWLRGIGVARGPAFFGGLVYMMGADLVSLVFPGGDGKLFVSALAPLVFWLAERAAQRRGASDYAWFALGIALIVFTSHMQLAYFTVWGVSLYFLFRTVQVWRSGARGRAAGMLAAFTSAGVLGVAAAAVQFVPPLGYLREWSHRAEKTVQAEGESGYAYSTTWSLHAEEAVSLVVPEFVGDNVQTEVRAGNTYWGRNAFKYNHEYAGLVPLLLVPLLFLRRRSAHCWFFAGLAVLAVLYGLGATTPAFRLFYLIPGVSLFRAPSLIIFLYAFSVATLGALALERVIAWASSPADQAVARRAVWIVASVWLALALLQSGDVITNLWQSVSGLDPARAQALQANLANIRTGFWIGFLLSVAVGGVWEAVSRGVLGARAAVIAFSLLAALDLYRVDRPFVRGTVLYGQAVAAQDPTLFAPDESIRYLRDAQSRGEVFRVFDIGVLPMVRAPAYGHANVLAVHGLEQLSGHHGNEIGRYRELIGGGDDALNVAASQLRLLDLANVGYIVSAQRVELPGYEEVFTSSRSAVYRNANALPRAYLVGRVEVVPDSGAVERILSADFDFRRSVALPQALPPDAVIAPDPVGRVEWVERRTNAYTLRVTSDRSALLVVSENYYPAWRAELDGEPVNVLRANYAFRAVAVPAGEHTVRFRYVSGTLRGSAAASVAVLALLLAIGLIGSIVRRGEVQA
jgi:hypothetical protein